MKFSSFSFVIPEFIDTNNPQDSYICTHKNGQCIRCDVPAMFDAYCKECNSLVLGDANGEDYFIDKEEIYESDINDQNRLVRCPNCGNTKMEIEYRDYCGYCQYMADKFFAED